MSSQPYRILVVDDEPDVEPLVLQRMRRDIRRRKYEFVFAQNGVEALDVLSRDEDIDMVISDINMPQMDGLTLLGQIAEINPNIRSIIVSAYGDMQNIRTAMNRGRIRLRYQAPRLRRPAANHRADAAPPRRVARSPRIPRQARGTSKRA